jgi:hypothetical protein
MPRNSQSPPNAVEMTSSLAGGWPPNPAGVRPVTRRYSAMVERFERFVTDWEFREYAYHL